MLTVLRKIVSCCLLVCFITIPGIFSDSHERKDSLESLEKVAPGLYTMDYGYDYDIDELLENGVSTHVELILYALNNTLLSELPGCACTTFNSVNSNGDYLFSRNFDYMDSEFVLVWTHPSNGYASVSSVSLMFMGYDEDFMPDNLVNSVFSLLAPYVPLDGINEKGLSIAVLELEKDPTFQRTLKKDLTTTTMIRAVLDKAATVDEAIEIFKSYDMRDLLVGGCNYQFQIADANGKSVIIEYVDNEMVLIYPEKNSENVVDYQVAANYYLAPGVDDPDGMGQERAETAYSALNKSKGVTSEKEAMNILKSVSMKDADLHGYICSTLWSTVYNTKTLSLDICVQNDYSKTYHFTLDNPQVYTVD